MFVLWIWRWLNGYVEIRCEGGFTERFINLCAVRNINLWNIKSSDGVLTARTFEKKQQMLDNISRIAQTDMELSNPIGLPQLLRKNKNRLGLAIGLCLFFIIINVFTLFVWDVQIVGLSKLSQSETIEKLRNIGIYRGMLISDIDQDKSERLAMKQMPEIAWISFNLEGSTMYVEISESELKPDLVPFDTPCNVKAKYSGQIIRTGTKSGSLECNIGDAVVQGEILISGIYEDDNKLTTVCHADGSIIAATQHEIEYEIPQKFRIYLPDDNILRRTKLKIFGFGVTVAPAPEPISYYSSRVEHYSAFTYKSKLPIELSHEYLCKYKEASVKYSDAQMRKTSLTILEFKKLFMLNDKTIKAYSLSQESVNGTVKYKVMFDCIEDIGYKETVRFLQQPVVE